MLNVVFASDDNYASFLSIAMNSLLMHNENDFDKINIYVLDDGISENNKNKIQKIITNYSATLTFIETKNLNEMDITILGLKRNLNNSSLTTYARLFLSSLLPKNINKVLYLDCDSLIVDSFKEIWDLDLSNYPCAAVIDGTNTAVKEKLGFSRDEYYINAGVLLINLKKWREDKIEEQFIQFMTDNQNKFYQHDQGIINNIFRNQIKIIEPKYNLQSYYQILDYDIARKFLCTETEYYTKEIVDYARKNPVFLHFCGPNYDRPWYNKQHPYAKLFKKYAEEVNCSEVIKYLDELPLKAKMFYKGIDNNRIRTLLKMIPALLIRKLVNKNALRQIDEENEKAKTHISNE